MTQFSRYLDRHNFPSIKADAILTVYRAAQIPQFRD